jgi:pimeloyl-ACP methyl ester carboxylesterase
MAGALDHPEILRAADVMTDAIKGAKKHIFSHSAHVPNMEEPEEFTQVVLSFLDVSLYHQKAPKTLIRTDNSLFSC